MLGGCGCKDNGAGGSGRDGQDGTEMVEEMPVDVFQSISGGTD